MPTIVYPSSRSSLKILLQKLPAADEVSNGLLQALSLREGLESLLDANLGMFKQLLRQGVLAAPPSPCISAIIAPT